MRGDQYSIEDQTLRDINVPFWNTLRDINAPYAALGTLRLLMYLEYACSSPRFFESTPCSSSTPKEVEFKFQASISI